MITLSLLVKVTAILALGLAAAGLARRRRAALRHAILAAGLGAALLLPCLTALPAGYGAWAALPMPVDVTVLVASKAVKAAPATFSLAESLAVLWLLGFVLCLLRVVTGVWQTVRLRRQGTVWMPSAAAPACELRLHAAVEGPMTCGVLLPAILLPMDAPQWPLPALERALVHESEHVRRGDWAVHCLAQLACAVYWFHPLAWMAMRQMALAAERACDDAVLRDADAAAYADQLLAMAHRLSHPPRPGVLALASRADLRARVRAILNARQSRGRAGAGTWVGVLAVTALLAGALAPWRLTAQALIPLPPPPPPTTVFLAPPPVGAPMPPSLMPPPPPLPPAAPPIPPAPMAQQAPAPLPPPSPAVAAEMTAYANAIADKVNPEWTREFKAQGLSGARGVTEIEFLIARDGTIADVKIKSSSGNADLDRVGISAITTMGPFTPLPADWPRPDLHMQFRFGLY